MLLGLTWPVLLGSGKVGTPWERMHLAYASGLGEPVTVAVPVLVGAVLVPR
jgi:hypothetical protein